MAILTAQPLLSLRLTATAPKAEVKTSGAPPITAVASLTQRLVAGDENAFREFHAAYFSRLYRFLLVVARGDEHQAKETLQLTLLRVVRYARVFDAEDALWSWLKAVARNAARDAGRSQQRYASLLTRFAVWRWSSGSGSPKTAADEEGQLLDVLEESLGELAEEDRELLESKYLDGYTSRILADRRHENQKALESRILRLRRDLRARMLKKLRST